MTSPSPNFLIDSMKTREFNCVLLRSASTMSADRGCASYVSLLSLMDRNSTWAGPGWSIKIPSCPTYPIDSHSRFAASFTICSVCTSSLILSGLTSPASYAGTLALSSADAFIDRQPEMIIDNRLSGVCRVPCSVDESRDFLRTDIFIPSRLYDHGCEAGCSVPSRGRC